ncbi:MAG: pyrroline-5-carboxylate reductase [Deltaproteobacteria bacterium]|nr:MAG: pyrroline-5-carboxylate reductase [Deltaproteobacteria bacterium]
MSTPTLAILGCGTMGEAILGGLLAAGALPAEQLLATHHRPERCQQLAERYGIRVFESNADAARLADVAVLCVKPQVASGVIQDVADDLEGTLLISICAGVRNAQLEGWAPRARVIRAMPNTPSVIREGMTVLSPGTHATREDIALAEHIFQPIGRVRTLDEKHMDTVTGLSGSGPAFACVVLEALADGGVMMGLPRDVAVELAAQTMQGAARLVLESGEHPAALKDRVTTPAGCTIAGLLTMEDGRIRSTLARTIQEAARVAGGLGQDEEPSGRSSRS